MKKTYQKRKTTKSKGVLYIIDETTLNNMVLIVNKLKTMDSYKSVDHIAIVNTKINSFDFSRLFDFVYEVNNTDNHFQLFKNYVKIAEQTQLMYLFNNIYRLPLKMDIEPKKALTVDSYFNLDNLSIKTRKMIITHYIPIINSFFKIKILKHGSSSREKINNELDKINSFDSIILISRKKLYSIAKNELKNIKFEDEELLKIYSKNSKYLKSLSITKDLFKPQLSIVSKDHIGPYGVMKSDNSYARINDILKKHVDKDMSKVGLGCGCDERKKLI